jgi:hypothetical protein
MKMAKARLYVLNSAPAKASELKGQARVVFDVLNSQNGEPKLASDIAVQVEQSGLLKTRQDVLRVTLYYIIVFKGRGWVNAVDQEIPAPSADAQLRDHEVAETA